MPCHRYVLSLLPALMLAACESPADPDIAGPELNRSGGMVAHAAGGGSFNAGVIVDFSFNATGFGDGSAVGSLRFRTELGGLPIEFTGTVQCMASDPANHRAWVGGVITSNGSTHPSFTTPIHQVGRDIWFRVVDYGDGRSGMTDRTSFVGFEGGAGIATSAEYCALRIWPGPDDTPPEAVDARTSPLVSGNLTVR